MTSLADLMLGTLSLAAIGSFSGAMAIVCTERWHASRSFDRDTTSIQKIHRKPVPRIGGLAIFAGLLTVNFFGAGDILTAHPDSHDFSKFSLLLISALPAFMSGLIEDFTKKVSALVRLLATFASAFMSCWLLDAFLPRLDVWGLDLILHWTPVAMVFTAFAVAGVAHSINIIDGFNGLAGTAAIALLSGIGFVAWGGGDMFIVYLAAAGVGAAIGFLCLNYPTGRVFLGDGGAYLLGFWIAQTAVLAIVRNPTIITWQILSICAYPIIEVLFTMYRRKVVHRGGVGVPDRLHLHSLIYRRIVCRFIPRNERQPWIRNAAVACIVMAWVVPTTIVAVVFGDSIQSAVFLVFVQTLMYLTFYARLVRGRWCLNPVVVLGFRPSHRTNS